MRLSVGNFMTIDGVMEAPGSDDDSLLEAELQGWSMPYMVDEIGMRILEQLQTNSGILLGRKTYDTFARFWPKMPADDPFGQLMNGKPKWVVSTTLDKADWNNTTIIRNNVFDEIRKLKAQPGNDIAIIGSGELIYSLMQHDLIDHIELLVCPVVLGKGKRMFGEFSAPKHFKLVSTTPFSSGAVILSYDLELKA